MSATGGARHGRLSSWWRAQLEPLPMLRQLRSSGLVDGTPERDRSLRLLACAGCRQMLQDVRQPWFTDEYVHHMRRNLELAYSVADGWLSWAEAIMRWSHPSVLLLTPWSAATEMIGPPRQSEPMSGLVRCILGDPWLPPTPESLPSGTRADRNVRALAEDVYRGHDFATLPVLADALEEAWLPPTHPAIAHLREPGPHARGCWALDLILRPARFVL